MQIIDDVETNCLSFDKILCSIGKCEAVRTLPCRQTYTYCCLFNSHSEDVNLFAALREFLQSN